MTKSNDGINDDSDYNPDFGFMEDNGIDAWQCDVCSEFPHPPTYYFSVHVWASEFGPSEAQRQCMRKLKQIDPALWPTLSSAIVAIHPTLTNPDQLAHAMRDWVSVHLGEHHETSLEFVYDLNLPDEGNRAYFIRLKDDFTVGEGFVAE